MTHRGVGVGSFLTDENDFALAMNMVVPYAFAMFMMAQGLKKKLLWSGVILIEVLGSMSTLSRGGFIGLVCLGGVIWWRSQKKIVTMLGALVLAAVVVAMTPSSYWKEMKTIETADQAGDTGYERLYLWGIGWRIFLDYPIFGVGPFNFQYVNYKYEDPNRVAEGRHVWGQVSHSLYFTLLPELGTVGAVLFVVMNVESSRFSNNTCVGFSQAVLTEEGPAKVAFFNNVVVARGGQGRNVEAYTPVFEAPTDYNVWVAGAQWAYPGAGASSLGEWKASGFDAHSIAASCGFDAAFRVTSGPCQAAGRVGGLSTGAVIQAGAYGVVSCVGNTCEESPARVPPTPKP